jgi:two-component system, LytTR family, response regulator
MQKIRAIVIEDEKDAAAGLQAMVAEFCEGIEIVGMAHTAKEGIVLCAKTSPDLIFLDVEMPGGSGFDLLNKFEGKGKPEIVFTTAHADYAIAALRKDASDYLLKPIDIDELIAAVRKVRAKLFDKLSSFPVLEQKIRILTNEGTVFVSQRDIIFIEADGRYCKIQLVEGKKMMTARNIGEFEEDLRMKGFYRIHKSYLINCEHIVEEKEGQVMLRGEYWLEIARRKKTEFGDFLRNTNR